MNTTAIAQHLNVAEAAIVEIQEWARVLWVRVKGLGARFVSKKVTKMETTTKATIQVCKDNGQHTLIKQIPLGIVLSDGRIQFETKKGLGFLVCGDACKEQGVDPNKALFDESLSSVHYYLNRPTHGKIVRAFTAQSCKQKINPEWVEYNNINNEGCEGYNPYPKYIITQQSSTHYL